MDSQRFSFKNFFPPHILKNNFMATAQVAHFVLPQTHEASPKAKQKEPLLQRFISLRRERSFQNFEQRNN